MTLGQQPEEKKASYDPQENSFIEKVVRNIRTNLIQITEDKLENILIKHDGNQRKSGLWINPLTLVVAFILTLTTTDPKTSVFGIEKSTWEAIFVILLVASMIWLIVAFVSAANARGKGSIDFLIRTIKNESNKSIGQ